MILWLVVGCTKPKEETVPVTMEEQPPAVELEPIWSPEEVISNLDALLAYGIPNPYPIRDRYFALYDEGGTPDCPGTNYNFDAPDADNAGCTTNDGYFYAGLGEVRVQDDIFELQCDCRIVTPDGRMIRGAGNISIFTDGQDTLLDIRGSFLEIKAEYEATWLEELPSISLSVFGGNGEIFVNGGYTINGLSLYMESFVFASCALREDPLYFRDPSGGWWTWTASNSCTKGKLAFQGQSFGEYEWDSKQIDRELEAMLEAE